MSALRFWPRATLLIVVLALVAPLALAACGDEKLTVYSGRSKDLVQPILEKFTDQTGIEIQVKYASTSLTANTILEEGDKTPADVVFLQDPGFLGALSQAGMLARLPDELLDKVDRKFRSTKGEWVGTSGRARTVVYNTSNINPDRDLPDSILDFTDPKWKGRIGWAPENASFQAFVTALRVLEGEEAARHWLEGIKANNPRSYPKNTPIVKAAGNGEIDVGFVNHYYLHQFLAEEGEGFGARNYYIGHGDAGALVLVAGVGILKNTEHREAAEQFVDYMLGKEAQEFFANETKEFPLISEAKPPSELPPLDELDPPDIDLSDLDDIEPTVELLLDLGLLQ